VHYVAVCCRVLQGVAVCFEMYVHASVTLHTPMGHVTMFVSGMSHMGVSNVTRVNESCQSRSLENGGYIGSSR